MRLFQNGSGFKDKLYYFIVGHLTNMGFILWGKGGGGSSGGSSAPSTSTSYSTNLPEYAKPYYEELMKQSAKNIYTTDSSGNVSGVKPYETYTGSRLAGFTPGQTTQQAETLGMATPGQFAPATAGLGTGTTLGLGAGLQGLNQAFAYNPNNTPVFGQSAANYYMNPYQQSVTDTALREARQQGDIQRQQGALGSIGRGTFGGARQALIQAEQGRNLNRQLSDIQAQGSQQGYLNAQQQFNADTQRQQQGQQYAAGLGQQIGMAGLQSGLQGSQALGQLGAQQQTTDLARLQAQGATGAQQQQQGQQGLDIAYQNYLTQQNYPKSQLEYLSNILRGNAGALGSTQVQYTPAPSTASQIAGLGLAGLGLYNVMGKGV